MIWIDWLIVLLYLVLTMALGIYLSRKASKSLADFFVSGRSLPWWLAGISMAATTFSIDTPLYVCGVVGNRGIAGNWEWWSFGISHLIMVYVFARMWRRSQVITDAELTEIRYGGRMAATLRGVKAFIFAVPINCIGIGYSMLAMVIVVDALEIFPNLGISENENTIRMLSVIGVSIFVLIYAGLSGLWGVVSTDFFQFFLAIFGALIVAGFALNRVGGIHELIAKVQVVSQVTDKDILSLIPLSINTDGSALIQFSQTAGITASSFFAYVFIQWWSWRRSDGGGEFVQRFVSVRNETEAEKAGLLFNVMHYLVRTWPWILVALAALAIYPDLPNREMGYPKLMLEFLPPGILGLVVASLVAAFMSTVSTSINWGASFITNDLYKRFIKPNSNQTELVLVGRISSVIVTFLSAFVVFFAKDVGSVFRFVLIIGTGSGLVLVLRWFWWRINAAAELAAIVGSFVVGSGVTILSGIDPSQIAWLSPEFRLWLTNYAIDPLKNYGIRVAVVTAIVSTIWIVTMLLTPPESEETLEQFYRRVRPGGIGWKRQRDKTGIEPVQDLSKDLLRAFAAIILLFGSMLTIGGFLLLDSLTGWISLTIATAAGFWLIKLNKSKTLAVPRPGLSDSD